MSKLLVLVDEANITSSFRRAGNNRPEWTTLVNDLLSYNPTATKEVVLFVGLPPNVPDMKAWRDDKIRFIDWSREFNGCLVYTREGVPYWENEEPKYRANIDVMMAVVGMRIVDSMQPDTVMLVTGDAGFSIMALTLRERGIHVVAANVYREDIGRELRQAANEIFLLSEIEDDISVMTENGLDANRRT